MSARPLILLGTGQIARALLRQLLDRADYVRARYGLDLPVIALANSRCVATKGTTFSAGELATIAERGLENGLQEPGSRRENRADTLSEIVRSSGDVPIVVDLTASDHMTTLLLTALEAGADVVLANKKPLCERLDTFTRLTCHPRGRLAYEATVGAGLPIVGALRALRDAGDELVDATACLSGTLGFVCSGLEDGTPLSAIVREARERGFTEPDPRDDLGGADVRRKALILARTMGWPLELDDVPVAPLIPLEGGPIAAWLADLHRHDTQMAARSRAAAEQGLVLRYVARLQAGACEVGLHDVPRISAVGRLHGADNILTARTRFYDERPLTISGPGAGPMVTAAAVFGDILHLAGAG